VQTSQKKGWQKRKEKRNNFFLPPETNLGGVFVSKSL